MAANPQDTLTLERSAVHHALALERMRARRCHEALEQAQDRKLRGRCRRQLNATLGRAAKLALALIDMGEPVPEAQIPTEFDGRLLDAMDSRMRKHAALTMATIARGHRRSA